MILGYVGLPTCVGCGMWMMYALYWQAWLLMNGPCLYDSQVSLHLLNLFTTTQQAVCTAQRQLGAQQLEALRNMMFSWMGTVVSWYGAQKAKLP